MSLFCKLLADLLSMLAALSSSLWAFAWQDPLCSASCREYRSNCPTHPSLGSRDEELGTLQIFSLALAMAVYLLFDLGTG